MALYISPLLGSENEKRMLSAPSNMEEPVSEGAAAPEASAPSAGGASVNNA